MKMIYGLISGVLFGVGLAVSGMINPAKVLNFLDLFGTWDPSLAFVMAGAIGVTLPGYWLVGKRLTPVADTQFHLPQKSEIDRPLMAGAALFGIGWGIAGLCPGPALSALPIDPVNAGIFVGAMVVGAGLFDLAGIGRTKTA